MTIKNKAMRKRHYSFWVYILTDWNKKHLYTGMTNNLIVRLKEHYVGRGNPNSFTGIHYCYYLVYYEWHQYVLNAIAREKEIKLWKRERKEELIASMNPERKFLNIDFCGKWPPDVQSRK